MAFESAQRSSRNRSSHSTTTKASQHDPYAGDSPPRTPPSRSAPYRSPQSERTLQPSTRETFLDDIGPTENARGNDSGDEPDPHDLALSPKHVTRTSIVDNMLLSLDQFAAARSSFLDDFGSAADSDPYELGFRYSTPRRGRGHTFSSSLSSDVEDDNSGRYSGQSPRGHRSNSSSTFQPSLQRITSVGSRDGLGIRSKLASGSAERSQGGRSFFGRRGSNSSASSSVDFGQMNPGAERRSASFDYGSRRPFFPYSGSMAGQDMVPDDIDAAPMPTVPAGPRSTGDYAGVHNFPPPPAPALSRRNSNRSARSTQTRRGRSETLGHASVKGNDGDSKNFRESGRGLQPPMPPSYAADPCAPSPTIGFNKPILPQVDSPPGKERPGFFRRVFGSSKSSSPAQADYHHPVGESPYSREDENNVTPKSGKQTAGSGTPNRDSLPVVNKKPSFFRRRKKSVADNNVPPPIVLPQQTGSKPLDQFRPEPSPVASLRSVMKPYLGSVMSPIFPPDSKDYPGRDISADQANDDMSGGERAQDLPSSPPEEYSSRPPHEQRRESAPARNGVLRPKYSLNLNVDHNDSFLADSSKNEGPNGKSSHKASSSRLSIDRSRRPRTSPEAPGLTQKMSLDESRESFANSDLPRIDERDSRTGLPSPDGDKSSSGVPDGQIRRGSAPAGSSKDGLAPKDKADPDGKGWLDSAISEEHPDESSKASVPIEGPPESPRASNSDVSHYHTASNTPVIPTEDPKSKPNTDSSEAAEPNIDSVTDEVEDRPSEADREQARKIFEGEVQFIGKEPAAAWLGNPDCAMVRKAYMEFFDWSNMNILAALRSLCTRLALKGETQQVDRVLDAFSTRWCECNPNHGFKATDVVHTICYSLLLLNTDLHLADIEQKMTRGQFIRNTMPTIHRVAADAAPDGFETVRTSKSKFPVNISETALSRSFGDSGHGSGDVDSSNRASSKPPAAGRSATDSDADPGPLVNAPFNGTMRAWEAQVEAVLKTFYNSIQKEKLPLSGASTETEESQHASSNLLGPYGHGLRRTPSTLSKSSDVYPRGRSADSRYGTARFSSKPRSRARLYPSSVMGSSRTSLDEGSSIWTPSPSSTWSKHSLGKTLTSMSVDSFGSEYVRGDYQQSIGFANALSQAIIREDSNSILSAEEATRSTPLLEDEMLELAGPPWAKEGSLKHKHHLDGVDKKAKDRNWNDCFAVIQQGWMRLFSFNASKQKKQRPNGGVVVGGGNWTENAEEIWKFLLRQTIASALPPPGYSKSRPHVWALSLPTGAVHLFQAGTPEIVKEWVSTANYWSARLSKEPLIGGVSNMEYGWSDAVINSALLNPESRSPPGSSGAPRPSLQGSIRGSIDQGIVRPRLPADRVVISDWTPPQQSMQASTLSEADQLKALQDYVKSVEAELQKHNELRPAMVLAFSPRHPNAAKAMANWERKSSYLLREIVKFRTYIDALQGAQRQKEKIYASQRDTNNNNDDDNKDDRPSEQRSEDPPVEKERAASVST